MINWFRQEHPASCVAACVRIVLSGFGQDIEEVQIRGLLGNPRFGLTLTQAAGKLLEIGAIVEWRGDWNIDDLRDSIRDGNYPIAGIERRFFGHPSAAHAVVITNMQNKTVEFLDPLSESPKPNKTSRETFIQAWKTAGQEVLILSSRISKI